MKKNLLHTFCLLTLVTLSAPQAAEQLPIIEGVGGPFTAQGSTGQRISLADFRGKLILLFFGYTNCPDVCPTTFSLIKHVMRSIGKTADQVQVLFVTVDPESDTPEHLREYLNYFHPNFIGVSGTRAEIDHILTIFKARYERKLDQQVTTRYNRFRSHDEDFYLYSHSQQIYLLDHQGRTRALFYIGTSPEVMRNNILQLIAEQETGHDH
ncbi:MAG: redoxin domain-containing protein [Gammaproteobacteria bacterium]|nr:redoxin domain-containing protein [Gammaproteobacteria bacterium]